LTTYRERVADTPDVRVQEGVRTMRVFKSGKHIVKQYLELLMTIVVLATLLFLAH